MGPPAVAAAAALVLIVKLLAFANEALRARGWWCAKLHAAFRRLRLAIDRFRHALREPLPRTELEEVVRSRMSTFRRTGSRLAVALLNCGFAVILLGVVRDNLGWGVDVTTASLQQQVVTITVGALFSIPQCLPYLHDCLWFSHAVYALLTVWSLVSFAMGSLEYRLVAAYSMQMVFFLLHLASLRVWSSTLWHGIFSTGMAVGLSRSGINPALLDYALRGLVILWLAAVGIVAGIEIGVKSMIQSEMESQGLQEKQAACNTLLRTFYDVILELDPELQIASGAAELGAFLQRGTSSPRSIATLQEVLPSEEHRQLIDERLCRESGGSTEVLHLDMRDDGGGGGGGAEAQTVELFSMSFPSMAGRRRHLVGIRAEGNRDTAGPEAGAEAADAGPVSVLVSCGYKEMPIIECSEAFNRKMGPIRAGATFCELLDRRQRKWFHKWMDRIIDLQLEGRGEEAQSMSSLEVRLKPTGQQRAFVEATCQMDFDRSLKDVERCHVLLLFRDWQLVLRIRQHVETAREDGLSSGGGSGRGTPRTIGREQVGCLPLSL